MSNQIATIVFYTENGHSITIFPQLKILEVVPNTQDFPELKKSILVNQKEPTSEGMIMVVLSPLGKTMETKEKLILLSALKTLKMLSLTNYNDLLWVLQII